MGGHAGVQNPAEPSCCCHPNFQHGTFAWNGSFNGNHFLNLIYSGWWFQTFSIFPYIGNSHPNWRTHTFQRGWNHQPDLFKQFFFSPRLWFWVYVYVDPQSSEFPGTMHQIIQEVKPRKGKIHTKGLLRIMLRPRFLWQRTRVWETHTMWFPWLWKPLGSGITCNVT